MLSSITDLKVQITASESKREAAQPSVSVAGLIIVFNEKNSPSGSCA
jgi:hypothetical protein